MDKQRHVRLLAWLYLIMSGLVLLSALCGFLSVGGALIFSGDFGAMIASPIVAILAGLAVALFAIPGYLAGKGLLDGKSWARVLTMILGVLSFFHFPLGTALCLYTFWVLWGKEIDSHFEPAYPTYHEFD